MNKTKILLTGGGGMVGRNLLDHPAIGEFDVLAPRSSELDLRDFGAVRAYLQKHQPDMVIHAAGKVGGIQANMREPVSFLMDNLDMGRNIVWAAHQAGIKRLISIHHSIIPISKYFKEIDKFDRYKTIFLSCDNYSDILLFKNRYGDRVTVNEMTASQNNLPFFKN